MHRSQALMVVAVLAIAADGCTLLLDFDGLRGTDSAVPESGPTDSGPLPTVQLVCSYDESPCVINEGLGSSVGSRAVPVLVVADSPVFDNTVTVDVAPGSFVLIDNADTLASMTPSRFLGIGVRVTPTAEIDEGAIRMIPITFHTPGQDYEGLLTVVGHDTLATGGLDLTINTNTTTLPAYSDVLIDATLNATGVPPLEIRSFGDVNIGAGAALHVDAPGSQAGAGGSSGGAGGTSATMAGPDPGGTAAGTGGGIGGNPSNPGMAMPATSGGGGGYRVAGSSSADGTAGGPSAGIPELGPGFSGGFGGGGGGGGDTEVGRSGGGGGGALFIETDGKIVLPAGARISAAGAGGGAAMGLGGAGGGGSGGALHLVARTGINGEGLLDVSAGAGGAGATAGTGGAGGAGRLRIDSPPFVGVNCAPAACAMPPVGPEYRGLVFEVATPVTTEMSTLAITVYGPPGAIVQGTVRNISMGEVAVPAVPFAADGEAIVGVGLFDGWNDVELEVCNPMCASGLDVEVIGIVRIVP